VSLSFSSDAPSYDLESIVLPPLSADAGGAAGASPASSSFEGPALSWAELTPDTSRPITEGEFGIIVRASRGREVLAVKLLKVAERASGTDVAGLKEELYSEARVLSSACAKADNVVKLMGVVEGEAPPAWQAALGPLLASVLLAPPGALQSAARPSHMLGMATLWYAGGDLGERLHGESSAGADPLLPAERLRLVAAIATGVFGLHTRGIVHADLRPANVLLGDGARPAASLAGFGLARGKDKAAGKWPYMAPEMFNLKATTKPARPSRSTDVYAMGVVAWELLTSRRPWGALSEAEHVKNLYFYNGEMLDMSAPELQGGVPAAVRDIVRRCLAADGAQRPHMGEVEMVMRQAFLRAASDAFDVVLSYSWGKRSWRRPFAIELERALTAAGLRVWVDMGLEPDESVTRGVAGCSAAVLLLSPDYAKSAACNFELQAIVASGMPYIVCPVELEGEWCEWRGEDDDGALTAPFIALRAEHFVDLAPAASMDWKSEPGAQPEAARAALAAPEALPLLLKLVVELALKRGGRQVGECARAP
jgi:serine/threonine protein kinase